MRLPHQIMLELTAKCNFRCPFCYCLWHESPALGSPELDTSGWKDVLDRCAADGVDDILFTGGETLMRQDAPAILAYARRRLPKATLSLFTNGSLLDEPRIMRMKRLRIHIATSLQGLTTYDKMTGTRRKCMRILATMARASELGWPIAVSITVTSVNMHEAPDMFAAAALSGASSIQMGPVMAGGRALAHQELMITMDEWNTVKESIRALPDAHVPYSFCDEFICECRNDMPHAIMKKWKAEKRTRCEAGRDFGVIGPSGHFRPCMHNPFSLHLS